MIQKVIGCSVQGALHIRSDTPCQDHHHIIEKNNQIIISIADGHGSRSCPFSEDGSEIAVNTFCEMIQQLCESYSENPEQLFSYLYQNGELNLAKDIDTEWKRRIIHFHREKGRSIAKDEKGKKDHKTVYQLYGTTLLGVLITENFLFAFQIGDGDICLVTEEGTEMLITPDKMLGVETHSLSREKAWEKAIANVRRFSVNNSLPQMITLSTDGLSNSYKNEHEFHKTLVDYLQMINTHGADAVESNLAEWLNETSAMGSGDDITLCIAYFAADKTNTEINNNDESEMIDYEQED